MLARTLNLNYADKVASLLCVCRGKSAFEFSHDIQA